jgi:hypothetical protein
MTLRKRKALTDFRTANWLKEFTGGQCGLGVQSQAGEGRPGAGQGGGDWLRGTRRVNSVRCLRFMRIPGALLIQIEKRPVLERFHLPDIKYKSKLPPDQWLDFPRYDQAK